MRIVTYFYWFLIVSPCIVTSLVSTVDGITDKEHLRKVRRQNAERGNVTVCLRLKWNLLRSDFFFFNLTWTLTCTLIWRSPQDTIEPFLLHVAQWNIQNLWMWNISEVELSPSAILQPDWLQTTAKVRPGVKLRSKVMWKLCTAKLCLQRWRHIQQEIQTEWSDWTRAVPCVPK